MATSAQEALCGQMKCAPPCLGVSPLKYALAMMRAAPAPATRTPSRSDRTPRLARDAEGRRRTQSRYPLGMGALRSRVVRQLWCIVVGLLALGIACQSNGSLEASAYDRSCTSDADCVTVAVGTADAVCCLAGCATSAINAGALGRYQSDMASLCASWSQRCPPGQPCSFPPAVCSSGTCFTGPPCATPACYDAAVVD